MNLALTSRLTLLALVTAAASSTVQAQRTDDNVTAESDDAFGRSVGNERIGIYNSGDVRGFSPVAAGNVRIEGLYFDQQKDPTQRLVETVAIRVGIAAQSYPFPAPTGIVDYELRGVGDDRVVSAVLSYGPFGALGAEVDAQLPIAREQFGTAVGGGVYDEAYEWGGDSRTATFALVPYWRPSERFELRPFFSAITFDEEEPLPLMATQGGLLPPEIRRNRYFGQEWAQSEGQIFQLRISRPRALRRMDRAVRPLRFRVQRGRGVRRPVRRRRCKRRRERARDRLSRVAICVTLG
jgi:iron complex outermembrane recepter protein